MVLLVTMRYLNLIILFFLLLLNSIFAQPVINNTVGNFVHNAQVTISGNGFGIKDPAPPLLWDDCTQNLDILTYYAEALPSNAQQGVDYNTQYRQLPFRGIDSPSPRLTYVIGGAHATNTNAGQYLSGNNVSVLIGGIRSFDYFVQYWYRIDPLYDDVSADENMKEFCLSGDPVQIYGSGTWGYWGECGNNVPNINYTDPIRFARPDVTEPALHYACSTDEYTVWHQNPINGWTKFQWEGSYNMTYDNPVIKLTTYPDGNVTALSHYGNELTNFETLYGFGNPDLNGLRSIGIGGFSRVPRFNNGTNAFRYFAAVYADSVPARVCIGDNENYSQCTIMEPQIPVTWNNNSILVTVNLGAFPDEGQAYLFVFNSQKQYNSLGFPIVIGVGSTNTPPSRPQNIQVTP
jgi:hypothetical protein